MGRGVREDLCKRLEDAHKNGRCLVPGSVTESHRLREAFRRGDILSPAPQVYALPDVWTQMKPAERERQRVRALASLHPAWVFAGPSAAAMYGLAVANWHFGKVHLACSGTSCARDTAAIKRHVVSGDTFERIGEVTVTSFVRTAFDCMRMWDFPSALAVGDSAARLLGMSGIQLEDQLQQFHAGHRGYGHALDTARLADGRSENGGESIARATMIRYGYMVPDLQVEIPNIADEHSVFRVDFLWRLPGWSVAGELDGREKYKNPAMTHGRDVVDVLADERLRESRISGTGVRVMRFSYWDVVHADRFCSLMTSYGIPSGFEVPQVAR